MKNLKYLISAALLMLFVMCGSSSEKDLAENGINQSGPVKWASYDSGLKESAANGKYMLAYFWRDG
ncbi:MAG: hypothetical protein GY839_17005 [candidate division Zixibacteria bacterium]|nr:hypothetical protein [candidate division Zixibacteria bacterium]